MGVNGDAGIIENRKESDDMKAKAGTVERARGERDDSSATGWNCGLACANRTGA